MAERAVGSAEGEVVGEMGNGDGEVRGYTGFRGPEVAEVLAMFSAKGETGKPGGVEAGGADDDVAGVRCAVVVDEASFGKSVDGVSENGGVGGYEGFEIAGRRSGTTTARVEVFGDNFIAEASVVVEFTGHLFVGEFACFGGFLGAFDNEFEALVEFIFDLFSIFEVLLRVLLQILELFGSVFEIGAIFACPCLRKAGRDPYWRADPVVQVLDIGLNLRHDLNSTTTGAHHSDLFAFEVISLIICCRMHQFSLEVLQTRYVRPLEVVEYSAGIDEEFGLIVNLLSRLQILRFNHPFTLFLIPLSMVDLVIQLDVLVDEVSPCIQVFEILPDLGRGRVEL